MQIHTIRGLVGVLEGRLGKHERMAAHSFRLIPSPDHLDQNGLGLGAQDQNVCTKWVRGFREWQIYIHRPNHPLRRVRYGDECENERETLTPSTTNSSPQTYRLASLARKTMGPAKSFGCPHRPAGIRSEICCNLTGSFNNFSFLVGEMGDILAQPLETRNE